MSNLSTITQFQHAASNPQQPPKPKMFPFSLRFTAEERERLKSEAGTRSLAAYIRFKLFGASASSRKFTRRNPSLDHAALARALGALGQSRLASNLNQIAKAANMGALPVSPELVQELHEACADVRAMRQSLIAALGIKAEDGQ